jgi:uncharacterized protein (DUF58 family)
MNYRTLLLSVLVYALVLTGLISLRGELLALALPMVLYLMIGLWRAPRGLQLEFHRSLSAERLAPGEQVTVTLTATNSGPSLEELSIEDVLPPALKILAGAPRHVARLAKGESLTWRYTLSAPRGYYPLVEVRAVASEYFGLIQLERSFHINGQLFVLPPVMRLKRVAIRPRRTRVYAGMVPARAGGAGVEFHGVREYQPSDSPRWVNWRATARHPGSLYANEFEQERVSDVGLVLDGRQRTNTFGENRSFFESSVLAAAALADAFLSQGDRVSLLLYGQYLQWTLPGYGKLQRERILQALSHAQPGGSQIFSDLGYIPTRLFPPQSQVVLISPLVPEDQGPLIQLRAHGYQVLVISPDPVTYESTRLSQESEVLMAARLVRLERQLLLRRLLRAGIQVVDWDTSQPFDQLVGAHLSRPIGWMRTIGR